MNRRSFLATVSSAIAFISAGFRDTTIRIPKDRFGMCPVHQDNSCETWPIVSGDALEGTTTHFRSACGLIWARDYAKARKDLTNVVVVGI